MNILRSKIVTKVASKITAIDRKYVALHFLSLGDVYNNGILYSFNNNVCFSVIPCYGWGEEDIALDKRTGLKYLYHNFLPKSFQGS